MPSTARAKPQQSPASPTLAGSRERLSAARVERLLGLPAGAFKKRRLYALRLLSESLPLLGAVRGDHLIVEPGRRLEDGRMAVVRAGSALTVRRVARDPEGRLILAPADPELLPFPSAAGRQTVVGTVIGTVSGQPRNSRTRDERHGSIHGQSPVQKGLLRAPPARHLGWRSSRLAATGGREGPELARRRLLSNLEMWRSWQGGTARRRSPNRYCQRLENRLSTLLLCMEQTGSGDPSGLADALAHEADSVVRDMGRAARALGLAPPPFRLPAADQTRQSA